MKFLAFVDVHTDLAAVKALAARAQKEDIDFVLCAGDLSQFGKGLQEALEIFSRCKKDFYMVPGNHETAALLADTEKAFPFFKSLHRKAVPIGKHIFLGYGEGGFGQEDAAFRKLAREWYGTYNGQSLVLVTHGPPFGTKIDLLNQRQVGNVDYQKFIERIKPKVVICGHIHETAGVMDEIGETKVINPGWDGMVIELP